MTIIKYTFSVLLYFLLLPISTPAVVIVSTWARPDDLDCGGNRQPTNHPHRITSGWQGFITLEIFRKVGSIV